MNKMCLTSCMTFYTLYKSKSDISICPGLPSMEIPKSSSEWGLHNLPDQDLETILNKKERYINTLPSDTPSQAAGEMG